MAAWGGRGQARADEEEKGVLGKGRVTHPWYQ